MTLCNLMRSNWETIDSSDLRILIEDRIGGPGQYHGKITEGGPLHLPMFASSKVALRFEGNRIAQITRGPHFDNKQWSDISAELDALSTARADRFGREIAFSSYNVDGWWRGARSGVQILPPPEGAPKMPNPEMMGEHPFILEIPLHSDRSGTVTNRRRLREHRRVALLLNMLLTGRVNCQLRQTRFAWAITNMPPSVELLQIGQETWPKIQWVQCSYMADVNPLVEVNPSASVGMPLEELPPDVYYDIRGRGENRMCVPADLDESICAYQNLTRKRRERFDRALFWLDLASEYWTTSMSSSFASLVSAIEALNPRGKVHKIYCKDCGTDKDHDAPSLTAKFRVFFEKYAPGPELKKERGEMYGLRSGILHGNKLIAFDEDLAIGWDPPWRHQNQLHGELWRISRIALRNYLRNPPDESVEAQEAEKPSLLRQLEHWLRMFPFLRPPPA
jgi:hypothetical protein